jgi:signal transduction histidine kinase
MKYRDRSESKGIDFYLENLVSEQFIIESSDNDINRILEKLIDNAIKFTRDGYIKVGYIDKGSHIVFTVRDTGIGIPPENQKNLFTKFVDEEVSKSRKVSGTGVDLALCNGLVKLLGGAITYNTASDKGSVFTFTIDNHYLKKR